MNDDKKEERKTYVKPDIRRVTLKPEESLAAGCKVVGGPAFASTCEVGSCFALGS